MAATARRGEQRLTWREQTSDWTNPPPVLKQAMMVAAFAITLVTTYTVTNTPLEPGWVIAAVGCLVASTSLAIAISPWKSLWRFELVVPTLATFGIGCLNMATAGVFSPFVFLPVLPVMWFAGLMGRQNILFAASVPLTSLVVPVAVHVGTTTDWPDLAIAATATVVFSMVAFIFNDATTAMRKYMVTLRHLAEHRDEMLAESLEYNAKIVTSERERRAAEQMFRGLWNAVTEQAAIGTDLSGTIDAWNPGAVTMLGLTRVQAEGKRSITDFYQRASLDALIAEHRSDSTPGELDPAFRALVLEAERTGSVVREWEWTRADGSAFPAGVSLTARLDESGAPVGYLFVANDLTEEKDRSRLKDEFVGLISHELRTPLSSILGYLELVREEADETLTDDQLRYLDVAERNSHRLLRLVSDLLFTAQVESGEFQLAAEPVALGPLVAACIESATPLATAAGITIRFEPTDSLTAEGDPVRLGQAIDNLISNAIKFTPRGGAVSVKLSREGSNALIAVSDTGIGIPAIEVDKLFSRFFRATTATRNAVQGVGLGLAITKAIVVAHHGEMTVHSEEGVGTTFGIVLPTSG